MHRHVAANMLTRRLLPSWGSSVRTLLGERAVSTPISSRLIRVKCQTRHFTNKQNFVKPANVRSLWIAVAGVGCLSALALAHHSRISHAESPMLDVEEAEPESLGARIRLSEVHEHGCDADRKWVVRGTRVYDITDWISGHPGGEVILRAVGGTVDPYWDIFTIHKTQDVYDILESYYIGEIDPLDLEDGAVPAKDVEDPFENDPKRDPAFRVLTERPFNGETPPAALASFITPNNLFYVRNHMWVPELSESEHKVVIEMYDGEEKTFMLSDLKQLERTTVTVTLQCSGNRRQHMSEGCAKASGLPWKSGGISTAEFTGVRLRSVLEKAGFPVDEWPSEVKHVCLAGAEGYGASIPIDKATDRRGDVILAYEMNGEPLPADHGFPIRAIVPGTAAARSVKWVNRIGLSDEESTSQWQRRDYKCFGPNEGSNPDWDSAHAIQEMPVQSAITKLHEICPKESSKSDRELLESLRLTEKSIVVEGYAFAGGGREIVRVDVSADDGQTWHQAELLPGNALGSKAWSWKKWRWVLPQKNAGRCFVVKAVDEAYNSQPERYAPIYNHKGNLTNAWHRVRRSTSTSDP